MEDVFSVAYQQTEDEKDLEYAFFGIFDGHGGREAAVFAKEHLMDFIVKQKGFWAEDDQSILRAIHEGFIQTHHAMWKELEKWPKTMSGLPSTAGTTASIAFIRRGKLYVGHVGDSAIVLGAQETPTGDGDGEAAVATPTGGVWRGLPLTRDHKPESDEESRRIQKSGGKVVCKSGVPRVVWNRPKVGHRGPVRRSTHIDEIPFLAVARSLGDLWSYNSKEDVFVVSPEPDTYVYPIDISKHRCLILGTDGAWNMLTPQQAVTYVCEAEKSNEQNMLYPQQNGGGGRQWINPSKYLVDCAINRWTGNNLRADNTSVVTVMLDRPGPPRAQVLKRQRSALAEAAAAAAAAASAAAASTVAATAAADNQPSTTTPPVGRVALLTTEDPASSGGGGGGGHNHHPPPPRSAVPPALPPRNNGSMSIVSRFPNAENFEGRSLLPQPSSSGSSSQGHTERSNPNSSAKKAPPSNTSSLTNSLQSAVTAGSLVNGGGNEDSSDIQVNGVSSTEDKTGGVQLKPTKRKVLKESRLSRELSALQLYSPALTSKHRGGAGGSSGTKRPPPPLPSVSASLVPGTKSNNNKKEENSDTENEEDVINRPRSRTGLRSSTAAAAVAAASNSPASAPSTSSSTPSQQCLEADVVLQFNRLNSKIRSMEKRLAKGTVQFKHEIKQVQANLASTSGLGLRSADARNNGQRQHHQQQIGKPPHPNGGGSVGDQEKIGCDNKRRSLRPRATLMTPSAKAAGNGSGATTTPGLCGSGRKRKMTASPGGGGGEPRVEPAKSPRTAASSSASAILRKPVACSTRRARRAKVTILKK